MKHLLLTFIIIISSIFTTDKTDPEPEAKFKPVVVLELFTSQGCSSCPSADRLLKEVKNTYKENDVITLSYHVDYWNYIGWNDPFSKEEYTNKQRVYGQKFYSSSIYTPQIVVNGKEHFVGSDRNKMNSRLKTYLSKSSQNLVSINNVSKTDGKITFDYNVDGDISDKSIRLALVINDRETYVKRGENRSRTLKNSNIVVSELNFWLKDGSGNGEISIPSVVESSDELRVVAVVQNKNLDVTGASQLSL